MRATSLDAVEAFSRLDGGELVVPVAYHVILEDSRTGDIPNDRLDAQTDSLNRQFEGTGIRFVTVSVDRTINAEWYNEVDLGNATEREIKRTLAIDPARVLNLYFAEIEALGWCYFPSSFSEGSAQHGCFMATGSEPGGGLAPYDGGDTATHEIGHFFGLFHTFADDGNGCSGSGDDVDDTPAEASPNFSGCNLMRDTCPDQPGFDPVTNFMDYSTDACLDDFTAGQTTRMREQVTARKPTLLLGQTAGLGFGRLPEIDFGEIFANEQAAQTMYVANFSASGLDAFSVTGATVDGEGFEVSFPDGLEAIGPGERLPLVVSFLPNGGGDFEGTVTVTTDDPDRPTLEITVEGTSSVDPAVLLLPSDLAIEIGEGDTTEAQVLLRSVGAAPLTYEFADPAPDSFVTGIEPARGTVEPGEAQALVLSIDATTLAVGDYEETLVFTTNIPGEAEFELPVTLSVFSLAPMVTLFPDEVSVTLAAGTTKDGRALVRSVGNTTLTYDFAAPPPGSLVTEIEPARGSVEPGETQLVFLTVDATTLAPGDYAETLAITTNAPDDPSLALPLIVTVTGVVSAEDENAPLTFALDGNFPNPFTPTTTIRFTLAEQAPTTLVVYDAVGSEVHRLVDETLGAGAHAVPFEAAGLASGAYFYRLVSGDQQATGSMVVLR